MRVLVTGSSGHLGEALVRVLRSQGHEVVGLDVRPSASTDVVGSILDRRVVRRSLNGVDAVIHTATLHKPHVASRPRGDFVETNVHGTLGLLEEAAGAGVGGFVFTSTTSAFGQALSPPLEAPAAWITEEVVGAPRNIYGATKVAAEDLCELVHADTGMPCVVLRVSRFFPEPDDRVEVREAFQHANVKVNELLFRRVDIEDAVDAHVLAMRRAPRIGYGRYIVSATTPFCPDDLRELRRDAPSVVRRLFPGYEAVFGRLGWRMFPSIDRVYVNERARIDLGWVPRFDFARALDDLSAGREPWSPLSVAVGSKGYPPA